LGLEGGGEEPLEPGGEEVFSGRVPFVSDLPYARAGTAFLPTCLCDSDLATRERRGAALEDRPVDPRASRDDLGVPVRRSARTLDRVSDAVTGRIEHAEGGIERLRCNDDHAQRAVRLRAPRARGQRDTPDILAGR